MVSGDCNWLEGGKCAVHEMEETESWKLALGYDLGLSKKSFLRLFPPFSFSTLHLSRRKLNRR